MSRSLARVAVPLVVFAFIVGPYFGAYFRLLRDRRLALVDLRVDVRPVYVVDSQFISAVLEPAHQVDKQVRPRYWNVHNTALGF